MSTSNLNPGIHSYRSSINAEAAARSRSQAPETESTADPQPGGWKDHSCSNGGYGLVSSPFALPPLNAHGQQGNDLTSHFFEDTTYTSHDDRTVGNLGYGSNSHDCALPPSSLPLAQPMLNGQAPRENESEQGTVHGFGGYSTYSSNSEGIGSGRAYGRRYRAGGYHHDRLNAEVYSSMDRATVSTAVGLEELTGLTGTHNTAVYNSPAPAAQIRPNAQMSTAALSQNNPSYHPFYPFQGSEHFEQGHSGPIYGPISHSTLQSSNSMCFRTQHRPINDRSTLCPITYHQEQNRGQIYNGNISGGVNNFNISSEEVLQYIKEHAATGAMHDSDERFPPPLCHPGTREAVIYRILDWYGYEERPGKPIMWVYAPAGYGKTAVAGTVAGKLEEKLIELDFALLGATFFFWRTSPDRNSPARFIITLAYQLFISIPQLAPHIENAIKRDPMILSKTLEVQLMKLIVGPFKALGDTTHMPNRLIIIDGLDECINSDQESRVRKKYAEDRETVQIRVLNLIRALASHSFPLSFLILSRPEAWIKQHMVSRKFEDLVEFVNLYEVGDNMNDVEKFVIEELSRLEVDDGVLVKGLVERAGGHMLYASTVIRHIDDPYCNPRNRLQNLLTNFSSSNHDLTHSTPFSSLYELYRQILQSCPEGSSKAMIEVLEELLDGNITPTFGSSCSLVQLLTALDKLSGREPGSGTRAIRGLHSVLHLDSTTFGDQIEDIFIHSSFSEFLQNPHLSLNFTVHGGRALERLILGSLDCIASLRLDSKAPDEPHVQYALLTWAWLCKNWNFQTCSASSHRQPLFIRSEWLEMWQRLLTIDLMACFVHAFTLQDVLDIVSRPPVFPPDIVRPGWRNCIIPIKGDATILYHSEPLAQQAVLHVTGSFTAAILHLLEPIHLDSDRWSVAFTDAVFSYLDHFLSIRANGTGHDAVFQALKTLRRESLVDFVRLRRGVVEASEEYYGIRKDRLDKLFISICSDNA